MKVWIDRLVAVALAAGIWACAMELGDIEKDISRGSSATVPIVVHLDNKEINIAADSDRGIWVNANLLNENGSLNVDVVNDQKAPIFIDTSHPIPIANVNSK